MTTKLSSVIKVETEKSNNLFINYFIAVNLIFILTSLLLYKMGEDLYLAHVYFHMLTLAFLLIPLKLLSIKIDKPLLFKYIFILLYPFYILATVYISDGIDIFSLVILLSILVAGIIYMSEPLYLLSTSLITITVLFFSMDSMLYGSRGNMFIVPFYRTFIILLICIGIYVGLKKLLLLVKDAISDNINPFIDAQTGVFNKHYLKERMSKMPFGGDIQLSIIATGIDNMKDINTVYGFSAGDVIIQEFITIMQNSTRQGDIKDSTRQGDSICRIEGDRFAIIAQHPKEFRAEKLAERIRHTLEKGNFNIIDKANNPTKASLTASFGVVSLKEGEDSEKLFSRAERALQEAKRKGKNRIERED